MFLRAATTCLCAGLLAAVPCAVCADVPAQAGVPIGGSQTSARAAGAHPRPAYSADPNRTPASGRVLSPEDYGAVGDGTTDDTAALSAALAALQPGDELHLTHFYAASSELTVSVKGAIVEGDPGHAAGEGIVSTDPDHSAIVAAADDVTFAHFTHRTLNATSRGNGKNFNTGGLVLGAVANAVVDDVHVEGGRDAGIFLFGAQNALVGESSVTGTQADGLHITHGSAYVRVVDETSTDVGDDGNAVVSYLQDGTQCHDIEFDSSLVDGQTNGRGLSVVGGRNITYANPVVKDSWGAAIYIGTEDGDTQSYGVDGVTVTNPRTFHSNDPTGSPDHGTVLVLNQSSSQTVTNVSVTGLQAYDNNPGRSAVNAKGTGSFSSVTVGGTLTGAYDDSYPVSIDGVSGDSGRGVDYSGVTPGSQSAAAPDDSRAPVADPPTYPGS